MSQASSASGNRLTLMSQLRFLPRDARFLFVARSVRLFAYGFLSVVLVLYLAALGMTEWQIGLLLTSTLIGDTAISLWLTTHADRIGRKKTLLLGALLMIGGGVIFAVTDRMAWLLLAATIGVISPSGHEVGPFLSVEQAALSQVVENERRTHVFAWYTLVASLAMAAGALFAGVSVELLMQAGFSRIQSYRALVGCYAAAGAALAFVFACLSPRVEVSVSPPVSGRTEPENAVDFLGLRKSRRVVLRLSGLFALDAFAGGFVIQSLLAYWFHLRFGAEAGVLGAVFFCAQSAAAFSAPAAAWIAARIGLVNTMVFTHLPSNVLLILVPLMPNLPSAIVVLVARFAISQMDVPTRQSYTMAVVTPEERSAAAGITAVARTTGAAISPFLASILFGYAFWVNVPFFLAGGLKIVYDLLLYRGFRAHLPPEEEPRSQ